MTGRGRRAGSGGDADRSRELRSAEGQDAIRAAGGSGWGDLSGRRNRRGLFGALRTEHGGAAAEFAIVLPAVLAALALCLGAVQLAATQLRAQDAAADAARAWARGDDASLAGRALGSASVARSDEGDLVCATVTARAAGAAGALGLDVSARGCALGGGL